MCRFLFYEGTPVSVGDLLFAPHNSIIKQSYQSQEREEPLNGDGFGLSWYVPQMEGQPGLFRSISPAWSNENLARLARVTRTSCVLAHVRAASIGLGVSENNCHPFVHGPLSFMHNGDVGGFRAHRRALLAALSDEAFAGICGNTDSEYLFAVFLDAYRAIAQEGRHSAAGLLALALERMLEQVLGALLEAGVTEPSYLNCVVADGRHAAACRVTTGPEKFAESLHVHSGSVYRVVDGECRMMPPTDRHGAILIASEQLSDDPGWQVVPPNHLVLVQTDRKVSLRPFELPTRNTH